MHVFVFTIEDDLYFRVVFNGNIGNVVDKPEINHFVSMCRCSPQVVKAAFL